MKELIENFYLFNKKENLVQPNDSLVLTVSGGKDSMLMLHLFAQLPFKITVLHCNFQLRGEEANLDEDFVRQVTQSKNIPFYSQKFDTQLFASKNNLSIQEAARNLRYDWFEQKRQELRCDKIATAHHQNDVVETMLFNFVRGTGLAGLHGIKPINGTIIRPLLFLSQQDIEQKIAQNSINYRNDNSNFDDHYTRNHIRLNIIPLLKKINPNLEKSLLQSIPIFAQSEQIVQERVQELKKKLFVHKEESIQINASELLSLNPKTILWYEFFHPYGFSSSQIEQMSQKKEWKTGNQFLSTNYCFSFDRTHFYLSSITQIRESQQWHETEKEVISGYDMFKCSSNEAFNPTSTPNKIQIDASLISFPLIIRPWQEGDKFCPLGMNGSKKISDYLIQKKNPLHEKTKKLLLVNSDGEIIWIVGMQISNKFKITNKTKKILTFEHQKIMK